VCIHSVLARERPTVCILPGLAGHALGLDTATAPRRARAAVVHARIAIHGEEPEPREVSSNDEGAGAKHN
jgi:hypothetical protein